MITLAFVTGFEVVLRLIDRRPAWRTLVRWSGPPIAVFVAYFCWRYWYYGLPLPTTYYAKTMVKLEEENRGLTYLLDAVLDLGAVPILLLGAARCVLGFDRRVAFIAASIVLELAYIVHVGGDWMPFNRFFTLIAPLAICLSCAGADAIWRRTAHRSPSMRWALSGLLFASYCWVAIHADSHVVDTPQERKKVDIAEEVRNHTYHELYRNRRFFQAIIRSPGEVLATDYGGIFGYYTEARLIEMWGLCNAEIALRGNAEGIVPIYGKTCVECYREFNPDYFHIGAPMVRADDAFESHRQVLDEVFQGWAINRVLPLLDGYATGRVRQPDRSRALFFIEKRRPEFQMVPRVLENGFVVDYPFEPDGEWTGE